MSEKKERFKPDLSSITFPTDQITWGQMRKLQPDLEDDQEVFNEWNLYHIDAISAAQTERHLARVAWASAIGLPEPGLKIARQSHIKVLTDVYKDYGISSGRKQTEEMVRRFEAEATRLANLSIGEGRG